MTSSSEKLPVALRSPETGDEELSEAEIESLLQEAETRLRSASKVEREMVSTSYVAFAAFNIDSY